jgi:hypothetical protein
MDAAAQGLGLIKSIVVRSPLVAATAHARFGAGLLVVEVGRAACLLRGHPPQTNTFVGEEHRGAGQQELAELQDWIESPALKKEDAAAEEADGGEENVVVPG